jgi:uncharacterized membrane protein YfcA
VPLLILAGVEPTAANGTNRVGVLAQSVGALGGFRREGVSELGVAARFLPATLVGAALGSWLAARASEALFQRAFALAMLVFLPLVWRAPASEPTDPAAAAKAPVPAPVQQAAFLAMGIYAGALQAGLGIPLLLALVGLAGLDLVRGNAAKVAINAAQQGLSLAVFAWAGKVYWATGIVLALGQALGGFCASRAGARIGPRLIRPLLAGAMLLISIHLFLRA